MLRRCLGPRVRVVCRVSHRRGTNVAGTYYPESDTASLHEANNAIQLAVQIKPQSTLVELWSQALRAWPRRRFLGTKMWVRGQLGYVWATYESINHEIDAVRTLLHKMGIERGSRVVVLSENRYEWVVVHFAALQLGAQFVPLPTSMTPSEVQLVVRSTQARVLFVESLTAYAALRGWVGTVGQLEHILCFEDRSGEGSYAVAVAVASEVEAKPPVRPDVSPEDTAFIAFTAGTTGPPKGVMLSHRNLVSNISSVHAGLGEGLAHSDLFMSLCSWCVAGALTAELYQAMCKGACVCIPPELLEGCYDLPLVNPTVIVSVAQPLQRAYANIADNIVNRGSWSKWLTRYALGRVTENRVLFRRPGWMLRALTDLMLGQFKRQFGSQLRLVIVLGHHLTKEQTELFADLDVFVVNTYGCMEAGGLIATDVDVPQRLRSLPGIEVRVVNDRNEIVAPGDLGELLVEAPNAMQGYFDVHISPDEARDALVEYGSRTFVRTGDYGTLVGGWVTIRGHKNILITLTTGKTVDPLPLETALVKSPFILQIFLYGTRRPYITALVVPNVKAIAMHLRKMERRDGMPIVSEREKAHCIRTELRRLSRDLPPHAHVRRFAFVDEFTLANAFLTVKQGYAREKIEAHYVHYFEALYDETPKHYGFAVDDYEDLF